MGNCISCNAEADGIELKSPLFSCILKHCQSSCMDRKQEETQSEPEKKTDLEGVSDSTVQAS